MAQSDIFESDILKTISGHTGWYFDGFLERVTFAKNEAKFW